MVPVLGEYAQLSAIRRNAISNSAYSCAVFSALLIHHANGGNSANVENVFNDAVNFFKINIVYL